MEFKNTLLLNNSAVIHCDTEWKAEKFLEWANENDLLYHFNINNTHWGKHRENTCYYLHDNTFCGLKWFQDHQYNYGYDIITFDDARKGDLKQIIKKIRSERNGK